MWGDGCGERGYGGGRQRKGENGRKRKGWREGEIEREKLRESERE